MMNHVSIMGRLVRDPEVRTLKSGTVCASTRIAVEGDYVKGGERKTFFFDVVAWRNDANFLAKHFKKGDPIAISGHLESRDWTDKNGNKRVSIEIVANDRGINFVPSGKKDSADVAADTKSVPAEEDDYVVLDDDDEDAVLPF